MKSVVFGLSLWLGWGALCARADAPPCPQSNHPMVELGVRVRPEDAALQARIERHLAAALQARAVGVCLNERDVGAGIGKLQIAVSSDAAGKVLARIAVADSITDKRVERTLELTDLPSDGRPLAIASSADELLRASWAELALRDAPVPPREPPSVVQRAVRESLVLPERPRRDELSLEGTGALWKRLTALGARARWTHWLSRRWAVESAVSAGFGLRRAATHGSISTDLLGLELGGVRAFADFDARRGLAVELAASLQRISFAAHANQTGEAHSFSDFAALAHGRVRGWLDLGPVRTSLALGMVAAMRASRASDAGHVITGTQGVGGELSVGCGTRF